MDINKAIDMAIFALVLILAAVLTYFLLIKIVAPPATLHKGLTIIESPYTGIYAWPPYFQLNNASLIYNDFKNYSLIYGPNSAPIKVLILLNPVMYPATNFTVLNADYIMNTAEKGLVQYEIAFNVFSSMGTLSSSPLTVAEINVASVAYCLYYNSTNKYNALIFLRAIGSYVGSNMTKVANLTSTSFIQEVVNELGVNINVTNCVNMYEHYLLSYQMGVGEVLLEYYVPPYLTPTLFTNSLPINTPILFMVGYNTVTGAYDDTINNIQLPIFVQNLLTQKFMYQNLNG